MNNHSATWEERARGEWAWFRTTAGIALLSAALAIPAAIGFVQSGNTASAFDAVANTTRTSKPGELTTHDFNNAVEGSRLHKIEDHYFWTAYTAGCLAIISGCYAGASYQRLWANDALSGPRKKDFSPL